MFSNFQFIIYLSVISILLFWITSPEKKHSRALILIVTSALLFATVDILSLVTVVVILLCTVFIVRLQLGYKKLRTIKFSFLIFLPLFIYSFLQSGKTHIAVLIGISYYTLKCYSLIRDSVKSQELPTILDTATYLMFYPVFTIGPIENFASLNSKILGSSFNPNDLLYGLYRVAFGLFKVLFLAKEIILPLTTAGNVEASASVHWAATYLSLLYLFLNFAGYSDIAIGLSRCYGVHVRENFNSPYIAKNIQEFWQRWHMSLGAWVTQYLYFPFVRNFGKPNAGLFAIFIFIGLWHSLSLNYFIWGALHASALVAVTKMKKNKVSIVNFGLFKTLKIAPVISCFVTITYIAVLSKFANQDSFSAGLLYLQNLI